MGRRHSAITTSCDERPTWHSPGWRVCRVLLLWLTRDPVWLVSRPPDRGSGWYPDTGSRCFPEGCHGPPGPGVRAPEDDHLEQCARSDHLEARQTLFPCLRADAFPVGLGAQSPGVGPHDPVGHVWWPAAGCADSASGGAFTRGPAGCQAAAEKPSHGDLEPVVPGM